MLKLFLMSFFKNIAGVAWQLVEGGAMTHSFLLHDVFFFFLSSSILVSYLSIDADSWFCAAPDFGLVLVEKRRVELFTKYEFNFKYVGNLFFACDAGGDGKFSVVYES